MKKICILGYPKCARWRYECATALADLNLCWVHISGGKCYVVAHIVIVCLNKNRTWTDSVVIRNRCCFEKRLNIRNSISFSAIKQEVLKEHTLRPVPSFYFSGSLFHSVIPERIKTKCSDLNNDLFINHFRLNPYCACTTEREDAEHYFFRCKSYENQRSTLFNSVRQLHLLSIHMLLSGKSTLIEEQKNTIFSAVHDYITQTERVCRN